MYRVYSNSGKDILVMNYIRKSMLTHCREVDAIKPTASDDDQSESDLDIDDHEQELLLAMKMSMATLSPKPPRSTVFDSHE